MLRKIGVIGPAILAIAATISGCAPQATDEIVGMANPAAVYCKGLGYQYENVATESGMNADCIFLDGSRCNSWDFLSGRCGQTFSYCVQSGGTLEEGANIGICVFTDGSLCSEFDYFEGRCQPVRPTSGTGGKDPGSFMPSGATE